MDHVSPPPRLPATRESTISRRQRRAVVFLAAAVLLGLFFWLAVYASQRWNWVRQFQVASNGMAPAIEHGDRVMMDGLAFRRTPPVRGDIICFETESIALIARPHVYMLRVAGLPGERLAIADGALWVNDEEVPMFNRAGPIRYTNFPGSKYLVTEEETVTVPVDHYFVLGDNTEHSADSRFWGFVPKAAILGRASYCSWPLQRSGPIE